MKITNKKIESFCFEFIKFFISILESLILKIKSIDEKRKKNKDIKYDLVIFKCLNNLKLADWLIDTLR